MSRVAVPEEAAAQHLEPVLHLEGFVHAVVLHQEERHGDHEEQRADEEQHLPDNDRHAPGEGIEIEAAFAGAGSWGEADGIPRIPLPHFQSGSRDLRGWAAEGVN